MGGTFALDLASTETALVTVAFHGFPVPPGPVESAPQGPMSLVSGLRGPVLALWATKMKPSASTMSGGMRSR